MTPARKAREARRQRVAELVAETPYLSDLAMSAILGVSPSTVANDRRALGIPSGVTRRRRMRVEAAGWARWT